MKRQVWFGLLLGLLVDGCSHGSSIVGKWKVDPALSSAPGASSSQTGFLIGFSSTFRFEFKADKTFAGAMAEGTYTVDGNKVTLTTTKAIGQPVTPGNAANVMTGELAPDGTKLTLHPPMLASLGSMVPAALKSGVPMVPDK